MSLLHQLHWRESLYLKWIKYPTYWSSTLTEPCWTSNRPAWSKIEGRLAHVKKVLKFINQKSSKFSWVVSQTKVLQRSNPEVQHNRLFIVCVNVCHLLVGRQNRPTLLQPAFSSLCSLGSCKTTCDSLPPSVSAPLSTDTKHSTVMYVCGGIFPTSPWYRMFSQCVLLCFLCACSFFKLPLCGFSLHTRLLTHTHPIPQCTKKHISYSS